MIWTIIKNIYSALSSARSCSKCFTWIDSLNPYNDPTRKVLAGSPFFRGGNGLHSMEKDFIKSFQLYEPQDFSPFLWRHLSRQTTWALESGQSPPLQSQFLLLLTGDCIPPTSTEILWVWEYNAELTAVDEYVYLLCLKWPSSYTPKIGAGVRRQLVNVEGTGGQSKASQERVTAHQLHGSLGWLWGLCGWLPTSLLTKELDQPSFAAVGGAPTNKFLTPVGCPTIQLTSDTIYLKTVSDPRG